MKKRLYLSDLEKQGYTNYCEVYNSIWRFKNFICIELDFHTYKYCQLHENKNGDFYFWFKRHTYYIEKPIYLETGYITKQSFLNNRG